MLKTLTKKVRAAENQAAATQSLQEVSSFLDKLARRRVIHPNKAANQKSRLARFANKVPAAATA